jgi:hypothetical protein
MDMVCNLFLMTASVIYIYKEVPLTAFTPFRLPFRITKSVSTQTETPSADGDTDYTMLFN